MYISIYIQFFKSNHNIIKLMIAQCSFPQIYISVSVLTVGLPSSELTEADRGA